jgi:hypothetical protein
MIDDSDDACVDGRFRRVKGEACLPSADEKNRFSNACPYRIGGDERATGWLSVGAERL